MGEGSHDSLTPGMWKGNGRGVRPAPASGLPPGAETVRPPPRSHQRAAPGDRRGTAGSPPPPPPVPPPPP